MEDDKPKHKYVYRFEDNTDGDTEGDLLYSKVKPKVYLHKFEILSETPKGYWIRYPYNAKGKRWVTNGDNSKNGPYDVYKRPYAHVLKSDAYEHFCRRKKYQLKMAKIRFLRIQALVDKLDNSWHNAVDDLVIIDVNEGFS